jgi:hypothetical protein
MRQRPRPPGGPTATAYLEQPRRLLYELAWYFALNFVLSDAVPNAFIRINPLRIQIAYVRVDQGFEEPCHD